MVEKRALVLRRGEDVRGRDFSGNDLRGWKLRDQSFFESIFNGCDIIGWRVGQSVFQHAEFTETHITDAIFTDTSFDYADFVLTEVEDTAFQRCTFQNAEWRDAVFRGTSFRQCVFRNTTTSLVQFVDCDFDDASASGFVGPSKRFTIFSRSRFTLAPDDLDFLGTTYGLVGKQRIAASPSDPLARVSMLEYNQELTTQVGVPLLLAAFTQAARENPPSRLRFRYATEIVRALHDNHRISIFALQYLYSRLTGILQHLQDDTLFLDAVGLLSFLRGAIITGIEQTQEEAAPLAGKEALGVTLHFTNEYDSVVAGDFTRLLAEYTGMRPGSFEIASLRTGSTFLEILFALPASLAAVFEFIKQALAMASVSLQAAVQAKNAYHALVRRKKAARQKRAAHQSASISRAVLQPPPAALERVGVFVDTVADRVLIVDGNVEVTIKYR